MVFRTVVAAILPTGASHGQRGVAQYPPMPVVSHLFAGVAASVLPGKGVSRMPLWSANLVLPLCVTFAYLPDIFSQILIAAGYFDGHRVGHSVVALAPLVAAAAAILRWLEFSLPAALLIPISGVVSHLLLDALQFPGLHIWFPFASRAVFSRPVLPNNASGEAAAAAGCILLWVALVVIRMGTAHGGEAVSRGGWFRARAISVALVALIGLSAVAVFLLREHRGRQFAEARRLIGAGQIEEGFAVLDSADRWPGAARPGRADYYRGLGYLALGQKVRAEQFLLAAYRADPRYLWVVIDLADFYARGALPLDQRRKLAAPYLESLARNFPGQAAAARGLAKVERLLTAQR